MIALAIVLLMVQHATSFALRETVFGPSHNPDHRYADVGDFAARTLPENAVVLAMQHSGTIRFYGGRATLRYDFIGRDWGGRAPAEIEGLGQHPYLVIEDWEETYVQKQFGLPADRELPWPQVARLRASGGVTVYDLATTRPTLTPAALEPDSAYTARRKRRAQT